MATSESDGDFESADEELGRGTSFNRNAQTTTYRMLPSTVDSESDDDTECVQRALSSLDQQRCGTSWASSDMAANPTTTVNDSDKIDSDVKVERTTDIQLNKLVNCVEETFNKQEDTHSSTKSTKTVVSKVQEVNSAELERNNKSVNLNDDTSEAEIIKSRKTLKSSQQNSSCRLGGKKLGVVIKKDINKSCATNNVTTGQEDKCVVSRESLHSDSENAECRLYEKSQNQSTDDQIKSQDINDLPEMDMPEELKSNKKFKDIFQPQGWEELGNDVELPDELTEKKLQPVLERLSVTSKKPEDSIGGWGNWENWGVTSLINTATAGVSTLTNHVSQGLILLEDSIGVPDPAELSNTTQNQVITPDESSECQEQESLSYSSFGFGNIMSRVSSITRVVEFTSNKVMTGSLDALEAIGKKTMEVLQDGDPGLKKKRAFFTNETNEPILSQILREAKEKAETEEKTIEERELAKKVHFESLFDDYQGLVHLEALEMLSKQSNIKIQQHLIELDADELTSVQETLEEIKELCDLTDEDEENKNEEKSLKDRLEAASNDLGVDITYDKLDSVWIETENYLASYSMHTDQEIFQNAISTIAQFTAFSVERFHKTAELLLIKERRSTVNEADALVQLANILCDQINSLTTLFCDTLNQFIETSEKPDNIKANITTIFLEATNANSYIQDAFRLLIPILQVGAI